MITWLAGVNWGFVLSTCADIAEIVTGIVAVVISLRYWWRAKRRREQLEKRLKQVMQHDFVYGRNGRRTPLRLSADLGFTVAEILESAFTSNKIKRSAAIDRQTKRAAGIFLEYSGDDIVSR